MHKYTHFTHTYLSILKGVTISGNVKFWAMVRGTPTWSMLRLESGVITVRAEKSTLFPIKLPRIRPSLLFNRCFTDFSGRPLLCTAYKTEQLISTISLLQYIEVLHRAWRTWLARLHHRFLYCLPCIITSWVAKSWECCMVISPMTLIHAFLVKICALVQQND